MKINKSLLPIKFHYFLRYAGSAFMTMILPLMVRQKEVSEQGIGFLWSLMPVVGLITNSVSGALADYFKAHRIIFLLSLIFLTVGLSLMYILPSLPISNENAHNTLRDLSSLSYIFGDVQNNITYKPVNVTTIQNATLSSSIVTKSEESTITEDFLLTLIDPEIVVEEGQSFLTDPKTSLDKKFISSDQSTLSYIMSYPQFWFICLAMMIEQMGLSTCLMISDAVCFQILGAESHKYGQQRLWGTIGMGIMSIVTGALVDLYSRGLPQTDYLPAVIICIVLMTADLIVVSKMEIPYTQGSKVKMGAVGSVLTHPQTILFIVTVYVMGTSLGFLWVFKLMHIEDVTLAWNPNFSSLKLLQGLDMGIETFGGEVPFFFLSGMIIQRLGHTLVFAVCLATLAVRCCLYYAVHNPWWFLPIELLNGISYGLFHSCMAAYASHIAPEGTQATLQAIVRAAFSTGLASAGYLGGALYQILGGATMFLVVGIFDFGFCLIFGSLQLLITKFYSSIKTLRNKECEVPSTTDSSSISKDDPGTQSQNESEVAEEDYKVAMVEKV